MRLDRVIGAFLLTGSLLLLASYTWVLFFCQEEYLKWWALAIPVYMLIALLTLFSAWIGWIMLTTPPPKPVEELSEEIRKKLEEFKMELELEKESTKKES
ncbi:MAG: transcriptional regulator [Thermoprotei archaeon]|nr:MAG: transcriptional regulator [Thermoprotei archaeon]RLF24133.1 MAG: transcriptional regulator [Thermoprotei archaeon]